MCRRDLLGSTQALRLNVPRQKTQWKVWPKINQQQGYTYKSTQSFNKVNSVINLIRKLIYEKIVVSSSTFLTLDFFQDIPPT